MTIRIDFVGVVANMRFSPGRVVLSAGVRDLAAQGLLNPAPYLIRHLSADWGDLDDEDRRKNDIALKCGDELLFSAYQVTPELRIWIITERDRTVTTVLLPNEY
jgi:hypothetical protein